MNSESSTHGGAASAHRRLPVRILTSLAVAATVAVAVAACSAPTLTPADPGTSGAPPVDPDASSSDAPVQPVAADEYLAAFDAALAEVDGVGVESIELGSHGFEVDVQLADGSQQTVFVARDGGIQVIDSDTAEVPPEALVSAAAVESIVRAATQYSATGTVTSISADDDGHPYEATLRDADGTETDLYFDESFNLTVGEVDLPHDD